MALGHLKPGRGEHHTINITRETFCKMQYVIIALRNAVLSILCGVNVLFKSTSDTHVQIVQQGHTTFFLSVLF